MDIKRHISKEEIEAFEDAFGISIEDTRIIDEDYKDDRAVYVNIQDIEMFKECVELFGEDKLYLSVYENTETNHLCYIDINDTDVCESLDNNEKYEFVGEYSYWFMSFDDDYTDWNGFDVSDIDYHAEFEQM